MKKTRNSPGKTRWHLKVFRLLPGLILALMMHFGIDMIGRFRITLDRTIDSQEKTYI